MLELVLDADAQHVTIMRNAAAAAARAVGLSAERVEDVSLAVGEASANVVTHAYEGRAGSFALLAFDSPDDLCLVVRDWGTGIAPRPDSPGLGLGLPLIGALADRVELLDDDGAKDVCMVFLRDDR